MLVEHDSGGDGLPLRRHGEHRGEHGLRALLLLGGGRFERGYPLRRHRGRVLVLLEPAPRLGGGDLVALHLLAGGVVAIDLCEELVDEALGGYLLERLALGIDHAHVFRAGDAEVRVARLADAVDGAAEHRDLDRVLVLFQAPLDFGDDGVHVELQAPARRARDQHGAALAQLERLEDLPRDLHLLLCVEGRQRYADRVANPVGEERAQPDR